MMKTSRILPGMAALLIGLLVMGCGSSENTDDSKLKEQVTNKDASKVDMDKIPEKDRAIVEQMLKGGGRPQPGGGAPAPGGGN